LYVQDTQSGCITNSLSTYTVNPTPQAPAVSIDYITNVSCNGAADGSAAVQIDSLGTPPFVFSWSPVGVANDTVTGLAPGNYNIVVVDALNCVVVNSVTITEPNAMAIIGDSTPVDCNLQLLGTMDVTVSGGTAPYAYLWSPGSQVTDSIGGLNVGSYSVTVTDDNGCSVVWGATIGIINGLALSIQPNDTVINPGTTFTASVNLGTSFLWTPSEGLSCDDCPNPLVSPDSTGVYYVTAVDDNGCTGTDSLLVTVKLLCGEYFVPTIFSPNGTGPKANNELRVFGKEVCVNDFNFVVYDRWGEKVFESTSIQNAWDGFYKGRPAQEGNYVYDLNIQLYDDSMLHRSGSVTLVR
jgi:gliding motility-associated-like protein